MRIFITVTNWFLLFLYISNLGSIILANRSMVLKIVLFFLKKKKNPKVTLIKITVLIDSLVK